MYVLGVMCGPVDIRGYSRTEQKQLRIVGVGCQPLPGGKVTGSDIPHDFVDPGDGRVRFFAEETLERVQEVPVPDTVLRRSPGAAA